MNLSKSLPKDVVAAKSLLDLKKSLEKLTEKNSIRHAKYKEATDSSGVTEFYLRLESIRGEYIHLSYFSHVLLAQHAHFPF